MYKEFLKKEYPEAFQFLSSNPSPLIFFEEEVKLSLETLKDMKKVVKNIYEFKKTFEIKDKLHPKTALKKTNQDSLLMSYDFHVRDEKALSY